MNLSEFANQKSMSTPGVAGALIMLIANTINFQFGLGDTYVKAIALILSFVAGLMIINKDATETSKAAKAAFYIFNSLIIFCVASGANTTGRIALEPSKQEKGQEVPYIKPITGFLTKPTESIFTFASFVQDSLHSKTEQRKKGLKDQAIGVSRTIQEVQKEIVSNHERYHDADQKLRDLHAINEQLLKVHDAVTRDEAISYAEQKNYQLQFDEIQNKAKNLRTGLTKKIIANKFFGNW